MNTAKSKPCQIDQKRLVRLFKDIKRLESDENRFCFLIGAGASKSSGIKTGWELSEEWYSALKDDLNETELTEWEQTINFDKEKIGEYYPHLYKKRYEASPQMGYEEFKKLMENVEPGIGYVILSEIITTKRHNFVITTNFDYLVEDAVMMYTAKKPFSVGHETLAGFVSSQTERPTIIKVHRDLFLNPFNDEDETKKLKDEWKKALSPILKNFNLLVIGYGGNDGSLMDYLSEIEPQNRKAIYWCTRNTNNVNQRINNLLQCKDFIVKIEGFDELMIALYEALECTVFNDLDTPDKHSFVSTARERINSLNNKRRELLDKLPKDKENIAPETKEIFTGAMKFVYDAYIEKDENKIKAIYQEGLSKYPNDSSILGNYAIYFHKTRKIYDIAEEYYKKAIESDENNATNIGNYALFLSDIRNDYDNAEKFYEKAIKLNPEKAIFLGNYAIFIANIRNDFDKAEKLFIGALELEPNNANINGNYAQFLLKFRKDYDKAERYYNNIIKLNSNNARHIGNYAIFLSDIRKDYENADKYFKKAIKADENNANNIANYALFLLKIRKDYDNAEEYFKKAMSIDPKEANCVCNYAHQTIIIKEDFIYAEELINKAFELVKDDNKTLLAELWFYRYAHYQQWFEKAEQELNKLVLEGAKSLGWDLESHIKIAIKNNHPNINKLQEFSDAITKE